MLNMQSANARKWTALHYAAQRASPEVIHVLLAAKASCSATGTRGETALEVARKFGNTQAVAALDNLRSLPREESGESLAAHTHRSSSPLLRHTSSDRSSNFRDPAARVSVPVESAEDVGSLVSFADVSSSTPAASSKLSSGSLSTFLVAQGGGAFSHTLLKGVRESLGPLLATVEEAAEPSREGSSQQGRQRAFQELERIGAGEFGVVYKVRATMDRVGVTAGKIYAMKVLLKRKFEAERIVRYAYGERNVLKCTKHPFLVSLQCCFQVENPIPSWVLVMEYCPGGSLQTVANAHPAGVPVPRVRKYTAEILAALDYLHSKRIAFRDLKPDNVVLSAKDHAKLTDFGMAKLDVGDVGARSFCGSYGYTAPEINGRSAYHTAVDIYSLGVTLYVLLTGGHRVLHNGAAIAAPPGKHAALREKLSAAMWREDLAPGMRLGLRATATDPEERGTADELLKHEFLSQVNLLALMEDAQEDDASDTSQVLDDPGNWTYINPQNAAT
mmetsp:Transcript_8415/g.18931  ORF Transcript_8415/g.18931 Transcript_8415/m.18931 type:complete len:502 (+) Transcript_8415:3-1508(+)